MVGRSYGWTDRWRDGLVDDVLPIKFIHLFVHSASPNLHYGFYINYSGKEIKSSNLRNRHENIHTPKNGWVHVPEWEDVHLGEWVEGG